MREALLGVAVGKKGIGKTYTTLQIIDQYVKGSANIAPRRALILDVNDEFENIKALSLDQVRLFTHHPKVEARRIRPYMPDGTKMTLNQIADALFTILHEYKGGLLLIEDINRYVSDSLPNDLIGALCTNRHTSTDIIMHFQSIGRITPKIWQNINYLRFHKNTDSVDKHKNKFDDKYEAFKICEILINKQYFGGNKRFHLTYNCDDEKIMGNYSKPMIMEAIDEYISINHNKIVKPLVNMKDSKGKAKFTHASAHKHVKDRIVKQYLP